MGGVVARKPEILIVEDEPVVTLAVGRALAAAGLGFASASDVAEASRELEKASYKLILSDLKLPRVSGFELLMLASQRVPAPLVVMITGYATTDNALESFKLGAFDFLPKPFDVPELLGVVRRALRYFDRRETLDVGAESVGSDRSEPCYFLGQHSCARLESDGSATLLAAGTFTGLTGDLCSI